MQKAICTQACSIHKGYTETTIITIYLPRTPAECLWHNCLLTSFHEVFWRVIMTLTKELPWTMGWTSLQVLLAIHPGKQSSENATFYSVLFYSYTFTFFALNCLSVLLLCVCVCVYGVFGCPCKCVVCVSLCVAYESHVSVHLCLRVHACPSESLCLVLLLGHEQKITTHKSQSQNRSNTDCHQRLWDIMWKLIPDLQVCVKNGFVTVMKAARSYIFSLEPSAFETQRSQETAS